MQDTGITFPDSSRYDDYWYFKDRLRDVHYELLFHFLYKYRDALITLRNEQLTHSTPFLIEQIQVIECKLSEAQLRYSINNIKDHWLSIPFISGGMSPYPLL